MDDGAEAQQLRSRQSNVMDGEIASQSTEPVQAYNAGTTETISWAISNFPRMREKDYSEVKYAGGYPWSVCFPFSLLSPSTALFFLGNGRPRNAKTDRLKEKRKKGERHVSNAFLLTY